jgi:hypothetical protein
MLGLETQVQLAEESHNILMKEHVEVKTTSGSEIETMRSKVTSWVAMAEQAHSLEHQYENTFMASWSYLSVSLPGQDSCITLSQMLWSCDVGGTD